MTYQSDILIGLQNFKEGKTTQIIKLLKEHFYDLCIKVNGGTELSFFKYKNEFINLKEIPYSILFNIDTYISDNCIINYEDFKEDIIKLKSMNISLKRLYISNNAILNTNTNLHNNEMYKKVLIDKINNNCLQIKDLNSSEYYFFLLNNSISRVDTYKFLKKYDKILIYQHYSFNNDINYGKYFKSCFYCSSSFCTNIINFNTISNIYGICSMYDIFEDKLFHNTELDSIKQLYDNNYYVDWLNLDNIIDNININNVNIIIFTKIENMYKLKNINIYYKNNLINFTSIESLKNFVKNKIYYKCSVSFIKFIYN